MISLLVFGIWKLEKNLTDVFKKGPLTDWTLVLCPRTEILGLKGDTKSEGEGECTPSM